MMNEHIQEIAEQATAYCDTLDIADQAIYRKIWQRDIADLIVRECVYLCIKELPDPRDTPEGLCAKRIVEYFGVE